MKKILFVSVLALVFSCKGKKEQTDVTSTPTDNQTEKPVVKGDSSTFDINTIPITDKNIGEFPYLNPPENYCYGSCSNYEGKPSPGQMSDFDKEYFAINGKLHLLEGKTYKSIIEKNTDKNPTPFNRLIVEKSYHDAIIGLGGVQVNSVTVPIEEFKKITEAEFPYRHSIGENEKDDIKTYVIRTKDKEIWIQFSCLDKASGNITILEKADLKAENVKQISASQLKNEIEKTGKAVLNINFDTDKATLKSDGKTVADEILKLLQENNSLKLSIEGYTDNAGTAEHNKKLSLDRANTIKNYLTINGIDGARLKVAGYGQEKPLAPNDSEENKAKNRRVELIKF
jgi:OmpA-OmpF porin, OOP family